MVTVKRDNALNIFLLNFIEKINDNIPFQQRIEECLASICNFFEFKRGFIYQTDGFRFFYLKESFGNQDHALRNRFEMKEMTKQHLIITENKEPFNVWRNASVSPIEDEILNFYRVDSLFIH